MVRWSSEPRRTPLAEESWAASLSRFRMACSRVIYNDDTYSAKTSQYIFQTKCSSDWRPVALDSAVSAFDSTTSRPPHL